MNEWNRLAEPAVDWLVATSWQAAVLALLVVAVQWMFRRVLTARWRYLLWFLVMGRLLLPSLPASPTSVYRYVPSSPANAPIFDQSPPQLPAPLPIAHPPNAGPELSLPIVPAASPISFKSSVFAIWIGGVLGLMTLLIHKNIRFYRAIAGSGEPANKSVRKIALLVAAEMKFRRDLPLLEIDFLKTPAVVGLFQPRLLLPRGLATRLSEDELGMIFRHEMAHLKRGDLWVNFLTSLLQIFHWFNPVLWWAFRRMRDDRELATDALALSFANKSQQAYGETLLKLVSGELNRTGLNPSIGILENHQHIRQRVERISNLAPNAYAWSTLGTLLAVALCLLALTRAPAQITNSVGATLLSKNTDPKDLITQVLDANAAALTIGCSIDSKWLYGRREGAAVPLNAERTSSVAIKGDRIISDLWISAEYNPASKKMVPTMKNEFQCSYNGEKYTLRDQPRDYLVSTDIAQIPDIHDTLSSYPFTQMFAFLVPRQGWVSYTDLTNPGLRSAYFADIKKTTHTASGDLVVTSLRADRVRQEVTFSAAHDFYPSKIVMDWDNKTNGLNPAVWGTGGESITEVVDWFKTDLFGKTLQILPKTIVCKNGPKGNPQPCFEIHVYPGYLRAIPDNPHFFDLSIPSGAEITEEPSMKSTRAP